MLAPPVAVPLASIVLPIAPTNESRVHSDINKVIMNYLRITIEDNNAGKDQVGIERPIIGCF